MKWLAYRFTAPTVWAATRCSIWWCSVALQVSTEQALREGVDYARASESDIDAALARLAGLNERTTGEDVASLRKELQSCMQNYFGVFRTGEYMQKGIAQLADLRVRIANVKINDKSQRSTPPVSKRLNCKTCWKLPKPRRLPQSIVKSPAALTLAKTLKIATTRTGCATPCISRVTSA